MSLNIPAKNLSPDRISIVFTWDDNLLTHFTHVANLFELTGFRCTFFVVPGLDQFFVNYAKGYLELQKKGFDIGSHSYSHYHMTTLTPEIAEREFKTSIEALSAVTNRYPLSFAFPYHDYNESLVNMARTFHLETRNTLPNSIVYHLRTDSSFDYLVYAIHKAILAKKNVVFSGHSIMTEEQFAANISGDGFQPLRFSILSALLGYLKMLSNVVEVLTFSQAALREFIKSNSKLENNNWRLNQNVVKKLLPFAINAQNIYSLI